MTLWFCAPADLGSILPPVFPTARDVRGGNHLIAVVASRGRGRSDRGRPGWLSPRDPASLQPHLLAGTGEQTFTRAERFPAARRHAHGGEIVRRLSVFVDVASVAAGNAQTAPIPPRGGTPPRDRPHQLAHRPAHDLGAPPGRDLRHLWRSRHELTSSLPKLRSG